EIMRRCARNFAGELDELVLARTLPAPYIVLRVRLRNGGGVFVHLLFFDLRPEAQQRKRAIEADVEAAVERIGEELHVGEAVGLARGCAGLAGPYGATVGEIVKLVEEFGAVPGRPMLVFDDGALPGIDGFAPLVVVLEGRARDLPGVRAFPAEEA